MADTIDILEIRDQPLRHVLFDFLMCPSCGIVDRDLKRITVGYVCPRCGTPTPSGGPRGYFSGAIYRLVDLMQEFYHHGTEPIPPPTSSTPTTDNHRLASVIFFCTLGEVLLQDFLEECMSKLQLPVAVRDRLFEDNLFAKQRIEKLFPIFTGTPWRESLTTLSGRGKIDYKEIVKFYLDAVGKRNELLHRGRVGGIPSDLPEQCIRHVWPLLWLFVDLHNEYLAQTKPETESGAERR